MSSSNCYFLTCIQISQEAGQVVWYSHLFQNVPQFIVIHTVKGFGMVNKTEINGSLELLCFFDDAADGNLISGSSWTSLNTGKFMVTYRWRLAWRMLRISLRDECNCVEVWAFFGIAFLRDWKENWAFQVLWPLVSFLNCWHIECSTFTASSLRIWNSSTGIPSPPLAYMKVLLHK